MSDEIYAAPYGFAALEAERSGPAKSRFLVLPVPYEQTTTFGGGTKGGPEAILRASREMELWDPELGLETADAGIHTLPALETHAGGPGEMVERIRRAVGDLDLEGKVPVVLGGEHTVSVGAVRAIADLRPDLVTVILDAHADLRNDYQGSPYSHACAARRISESCPVVQVGVRSLSSEEDRFLRGRDWALIPARDIRPDADWISPILSRIKGRPVYLSIDLDALDPGIMPAVGTPEPGGMGWSDLTALTAAIARSAEIVAFDVVELAPIAGFTAPDFLAAKLIYRIMGQIITRT